MCLRIIDSWRRRRERRKAGRSVGGGAIVNAEWRRVASVEKKAQECFISEREQWEMEEDQSA